MRRITRKTALPAIAGPLFLALLALGVVACKPGDKAKPEGAKAEDAAAKAGDDAIVIPGLDTEKDRVSYMVGLDIGKSLETVKDDIDVDVVAKAIRTTLAGEKPLMDEEQATKVREAFGEKVQARQIAEMMAKAKKNAEAGEAFLAANGKKPGVVTTDSGLQYEVLEQGKGPKPKPTDVVKVNYTGMLLDGKTFDSSAQHGGPAEIPLAQVVPGWREGVSLMPVGSKYRFWIPGKLGYGDKVPPGAPIGPNETLVFEVELLDIAKPDKQ